RGILRQRLVVGGEGVVVNIGHIDVGHGTVIAERAAVPGPPDIAHAAVAESIVDAAVVPHVGAPIPAVREEGATPPAPVARGPQRARIRRKHPGSGHPVVALGTVSPVPWGPD